jgi:ring-1,2-phenylacetyl-CoA epoxidase subunit PaaC
VKYHLQHASQWVIRLGDGTMESHTRMQKAIDDFWMYTGELFEMDDAEQQLQHENIAIDRSSLKEKWLSDIKAVLNEATLAFPQKTFMQTGSSKGNHTEHLGHILSEMQYLQRAYPDAKW